MSKANKRADLRDLTTFDDWNFEVSLEAVHEAMRKSLRECVEIALTGEGDRCPELSFPIEWYPRSDGFSGQPVADPLTVYVNFPYLSANHDSGPFLKFNIRDALSHSLDDAAKDGSFSKGLKLLADALQALADDIRRLPEKSGH